MRCVSWGCVGMYLFMRSIGVSGLFLIRRTWRYGDIGLGVGILVMFSFVSIALGIMTYVPPLALLAPEYLFCCCVVLFELL